MSNDLASLLLDVVILILLGSTIYYVIRLTKGLENFKKHRQEFDSVIANLLASIDQADHSVRTLKKVSTEEAGRLERSVAQAKLLCDDLEIITEAGEGMAKRLEKLAEINRKIVQPTQNRPSSKKSQRGFRKRPKESSSETDKISSPVYSDEEQKKKTSRYDSTLKRVEKKEDNKQNYEKKDLPSFMIKDREFGDLGALENRLDSSASNDGTDDENEEDDAMPRNLRSQAEKELFDALRNTRKNVSGK